MFRNNLSHIGTPYHVQIWSDHQVVKVLENLVKPDRIALSAGSTPTTCTFAFLLLRYRPVPVTVPPVPMPATNMSTSPDVASHISGPAERNFYRHYCLIFNIKLEDMNDSGTSVWSCASPVVRKWALGFSGFWNWLSMWEFGVFFSNSSNTLKTSGSPFAPSALPMQNESHNRQKQKLENPSTRLSWIGKHCSIKVANSVGQGERIWAFACVKDDRACGKVVTRMFLD